MMTADRDATPATYDAAAIPIATTDALFCMREQVQIHDGTDALHLMAIRAGGATQINETTKH